jgi:hypothetical protein
MAGRERSNCRREISDVFVIRGSSGEYAELLLSFFRLSSLINSLSELSWPYAGHAVAECGLNGRAYSPQHTLSQFPKPLLHPKTIVEVNRAMLKTATIVLFMTACFGVIFTSLSPALFADGGKPVAALE